MLVPLAIAIVHFSAGSPPVLAVPVPAVPAYNLSVGRVQLAGATAGRFALFAGGYDASGKDSAVVDVLDTQSWAWSTSALSAGRGVMGAAGLVAPNGSAIAAFAGGKHAHANRTDVVDFALFAHDAPPGAPPAWRTARLRRPRSMVAVVPSADGSLLFFAGGEYQENEANQTVDECSDTVEVWDVAAADWAPVSPLTLSQPRKKLAAAALADGRVLFGGGYLSGVGNVATVDTYDAKAHAWGATANLSTPRFRLQAATVPAAPGGGVGGDAALFISGQGCDWTCATADLFDGSGGKAKWSVTDMVHGRYEFAAIPVGGLVVVAGGKQPRPIGIDPHVIDVFDPAIGSWRSGSYGIQTPRFYGAGAGAAASPYGPVAIFAGGIDGGDFSSIDFVPTTGL